MARGYGGEWHRVASVCVKGIIITLPQKLLTGGGYFTYRLPNTEHCIAYTVYRMPALFLTHCLPYS